MSRIEKAQAALRREIADILRKDVADPRIGFLSVIRVKLSPDFAHARVYVSIFGEKKSREEVMEGLTSATPFIRREIARRLNFKFTPEISFVYDDSLAKAARLFDVMQKLKGDKR